MLGGVEPHHELNLFETTELGSNIPENHEDCYDSGILLFEVTGTPLMEKKASLLEILFQIQALPVREVAIEIKVNRLPNKNWFSAFHKLLELTLHEYPESVPDDKFILKAPNSHDKGRVRSYICFALFN